MSAAALTIPQLSVLTGGKQNPRSRRIAMRMPMYPRRARAFLGSPSAWEQGAGVRPERGPLAGCPSRPCCSCSRTTAPSSAVAPSAAPAIGAVTPWRPRSSRTAVSPAPPPQRTRRASPRRPCRAPRPRRRTRRRSWRSR
eukprot:354984-Chlamydomonas_euryale.AAC.6